MLSPSLNPDRATLNFLNAYTEDVRAEGEKLQKEGAVTQIFGNHLFIQGRVETKVGVFTTSLRLRGNRWYGSCKAEDERVSGACQVATMIERLYRGANMPESPNELNEIPLSDVLEEKLGRDLDDSEADYVTKLEKRYRRFAIEQEIHDHDIVRLNPRWEVTSYDALELWPEPPHNILEFWNYIAYAFTKKRIAYPEFMNAVTDLGKVQKRISAWEREKEAGAWCERIRSVNERPPQPPRYNLFMRLVSTINEAHFEYRLKENEDWIPIREHAQLEQLISEFLHGAIMCDPQTDILLNVLRDYAERAESVVLDLDKEEACRVMNRLFHQRALKGYLVNLDECYFKVVAEPLKWVCIDDPILPDCYGLQLVTAAGVHVTHSVRQLPGLVELYQSDETVFPGPPRWLESTEVEPRYSIPKTVLDSMDGVEFLRKIGATLPPSMEERVVDIEMKPTFTMKIVRGLTSADTEHVLLEVTAQDDPGRRKERLGKDDWELVEQKPVKDGTLIRFIREYLYPIPDLLEEMSFTYDSQMSSFKSRITKQFPEKFAEWCKAIPKTITTKLDSSLESLLEDPVAAAIRFEVVNQEIDWFDLRVVIDVEGVTLTKEQIRSSSPPAAVTCAWTTAAGCAWKSSSMTPRGTLSPSSAWIRLTCPARRTACMPCSWRTRAPQRCSTPRPGSASKSAPRKSRSMSSPPCRIPCRPPCAPTRRKASTSSPTWPSTASAVSWQTIWAWARPSSPSPTSCGCVRNTCATTRRVRRRLWCRPSSLSAPSPCWTCGPAKPPSSPPACGVLVIRNKEQAVVDEIMGSYDMVVINYAQLRVCGEQLNSIKWLSVILDEGQQIKNPDSKAAKAARDISAFNRLVLSGTPIENRLLDMWSLMAFAMPGVLGSRAYFKKRFDKRKDSQSQNRLAARLKPFLLRRTKQQVAKDLPPRTEEEIYAKMSGIQRQLYKAELHRIQKALLGVDSDESVKKNSFAILQGLMRLRQICCHPGLVDQRYLKEESAKLNALFYLLDQLRDEGHKVLVFSQFVSMLEIIKSRLDAEGRPYNYLTGQTKDRKAEIEKFQTTKEPSVFLLSLKAGGAGLNLTSASYVVLYDPWWNPAVENQAIDRTHRIGQKNKVIAYRLLTRDSVEEKIRVLQQQKNQLVTNVLGDEGFASSLTSTTCSSSLPTAARRTTTSCRMQKNNPPYGDSVGFEAGRQPLPGCRPF